jgi:hypothetical protein
VLIGLRGSVPSVQREHPPHASPQRKRLVRLGRWGALKVVEQTAAR